jgi:hypothetical protein
LYVINENELIRVTVTNNFKKEHVYDGMRRLRVYKEFTWSGHGHRPTKSITSLMAMSLSNSVGTNDLPPKSTPRVNQRRLINMNQLIIAQYEYDPFGNPALRNKNLTITRPRQEKA